MKRRWKGKRRGTHTNQCTRKVAYKTRRDAYVGLKAVRAREAATANRDRLKIYKCPHCGMFHIGKGK